MTIKKLVLGVSGGIDSVVLLDVLSKNSDYKIIVAHFDHGIRATSAEDARFVQSLAEKYHLPFEMCREDLGTDCSEDYARIRRYAFLRTIAKKYDATIAVAHHKNDVVESVAINCIRGTGWRGLAVCHSKDIFRPFLGVAKSWITTYAHAKNLIWHDDETNTSMRYLRNRVRARIEKTNSQRLTKNIYELRTRQVILQKNIDAECSTILQRNGITQETSWLSRYFFSHIDERSATELLRYILLQKTKKTLLPAQRHALYLKIKTAKANTFFEAGEKVRVEFSKTHFNISRQLW